MARINCPSARAVAHHNDSSLGSWTATAEVGMKLHVCSIDKDDMQVICRCKGHVRFDQGGS